MQKYEDLPLLGSRNWNLVSHSRALKGFLCHPLQFFSLFRSSGLKCQALLESMELVVQWIAPGALPTRVIVTVSSGCLLKNAILEGFTIIQGNCLTENQNSYWIIDCERTYIIIVFDKPSLGVLIESGSSYWKCSIMLHYCAKLLTYINRYVFKSQRKPQITEMGALYWFRYPIHVC